MYSDAKFGFGLTSGIGNLRALLERAQPIGFVGVIVAVNAQQLVDGAAAVAPGDVHDGIRDGAAGGGVG